ncbi:glycoside hydrolase family 99-like domain-containing protein [Megalodesulfovibrio gigas]|uniref:Putative glycosyl transferase n=1 Tax=Megalodesulfovibrio gigas (strain ATCC 19364 / DSM 1382 / NCIMB 9332 / VKM B-1759) TaxID=1121448 RepID=T2GG01_MEGG1|nr:glycoside hydrolase family 99-like domain-containing protein [Megalodesulfovibrio gigas]AGW15253.1 putative glycosyl transferase [Megalodesulfovibrio gigas DSM 1382 = ATCC 19364]
MTARFHKLRHGVRAFGLPAVLRSLTQYARRTRLRPQPVEPVAHEPQGPALQDHPAVKAIAYYLPQFHPIPENDAWWGEGFTEWTNVYRARPLFPGHVQPDFPGELGEYDLRDPDVMRRQIALARHHGLHGFCFHYYWFCGKRLLEHPLEQLLADPSLDVPFCLNWANESWSRRWDGSSEVLMPQAHSPEDDAAVMRDLLRYFNDPRYIRIDGRPLFLLYRPALLPDVRATLDRWRAVCAAEGAAAPFFVMVQSFGMHDPRPYGFDAAAQFPPHLGHTPFGYARTRPVGLTPEFSGRVFPYAELARVTLAGLDAPYPTFPCVCPGWDNTPRRGTAATVFLNATPRRYTDWLTAACGHAMQAFDETRRFVFINAWNEWAEGAHLEPNLAHGHAFLNATTRVLARRPAGVTGTA